MNSRLRSIVVKKRVAELQKTLLKIGIVFLHSPFAPRVRQFLRMCGRQFVIIDSRETDDTMYIYAGLSPHHNYRFKDAHGHYTKWVINPDTGGFSGTDFVKHAMYLRFT